MAFRIRRGQPLPLEITRLFDRELSQAMSCLAETGAAEAEGLHDARRHIKKARAILQLARPVLFHDYDRADKALRTANRALGAQRDACALVDALTRMPGRDAVIPAERLEAIRARLAQSSVIRAGYAGDLHARVVRLLDSIRRAAADWDLRGIDDAVLAAEILRAHADASEARRAVGLAGVARAHRWRRRVKREGHLLRLVGHLTGNQLIDEQRRLESLDAALGELHDVQALAVALAADSPLTRYQTAAVVRVLRAWARDLHGRARMLDQYPCDLERRIVALWETPALPNSSVAFAAPGV